MTDGNSEQIRQIIAEAVRQANTFAREEDGDERERGLRAQLTMTEKVVGACLIALIGWVGLTVQNTDKRVAVIEARLSVVAEGRYSAGDAAKDQRVLVEQIDSLRARVVALEAYHRGSTQQVASAGKLP